MLGPCQLNVTSQESFISVVYWHAKVWDEQLKLVKCRTNEVELKLLVDFIVVFHPDVIDTIMIVVKDVPSSIMEASESYFLRLIGLKKMKKYTMKKLVKNQMISSNTFIL